jgi:hypothetical protein
MDINNLTNVYNQNPTLQGQYTLQQYLDLFGGTPPTATIPPTDPNAPTTPITPDQGIINANINQYQSGGGGGVQSLQSTYTPGATNAPIYNPNINPAFALTGKGRSDPMGSDVDYFNSLPADQKFNFGFKDSSVPGQKGYVAPSKYFEEPSAMQKGITGVKDFFGKFSSPKVRGKLGNRLQKQFEFAQKLPSFISAIASMQSPFNPSSGNYNPNMASQLNYLEGMDGTKISGTYKDPFNKSLGFTDDLTGQAMIGRDPNSGGLKYGPGTVLEGKNVISGFGFNNYETALEKYLEKMQSYKKKTTFQQKKIDRANKELEDYQNKEKERQQKEADDKAKQASGLTDRQNIEAIQNYTGRQISDYRASRPASERNYTGGSNNSNPSTPGAQDSFSNKSGMGRTGYRYGGNIRSYFNGGIAGFKNGGRINFRGGGMDMGNASNQAQSASMGSSKSSTNQGPAGGASSGGNYGGNRNPKQTYGGGGGRPKTNIITKSGKDLAALFNVPVQGIQALFGNPFNRKGGFLTKAGLTPGQIENLEKNANEIGGLKGKITNTTYGSPNNMFGFNKNMDLTDFANSATFGQGNFTKDPTTGKISLDGGNYDFKQDQFGKVGNFINDGGVSGFVNRNVVEPISKFGANLYEDQVNNPNINYLASGGRVGAKDGGSMTQIVKDRLMEKNPAMWGLGYEGLASLQDLIMSIPFNQGGIVNIRRR